MKKTIALLIALSVNYHASSQTKEISRDWTSFSQSVDASFLKKKVKFKVTAFAKADVADSTAAAGIWVRVDNKNGERGFFDNMAGRPIRTNVWQAYTVEGFMDENAEKINFGGLCVSNGKFYFDNFEFYIENDKGKFQKAHVDNPGFEEPVVKNVIPKWSEGTNVLYPIRVKEYTFSSSKDKVHGNLSLMVEGKGIAKDTSNLIGPIKGYTPQIGTLITMLNNLSKRVEVAVNMLNEKETDHLMDDKANTIGSLVMHLAAAEAYYQVFTFENREFNEEEKKKWGAALDLGEEGRSEFKGHDIAYYLNAYREVRKKTIEELAKRNDEWLAQTLPGADLNNYFCWFHVMEHQSSHLGQILMMKKRLPKREVKQEVKVDLEH